MDVITELQEELNCERATGCRGAGAYRQAFEEMGYNRLEVLNWSSSAGDWQFIVSKDGLQWHIAEQSNNWPRAGFSYYVDTEQVFEGSADDVMEEINRIYS